MKIMQPLFSPTDSGGAGMKELDKAIAVLGQINILIPVVYAAGKSIATIIKSGLGSTDPKTVEEAKAAVAAFEEASRDVRQTAEEWLATHPRT